MCRVPGVSIYTNSARGLAMLIGRLAAAGSRVRDM